MTTKKKVLKLLSDIEGAVEYIGPSEKTEKEAHKDALRWLREVYNLVSLEFKDA